MVEKNGVSDSARVEGEDEGVGGATAGTEAGTQDGGESAGEYEGPDSSLIASVIVGWNKPP